MEKNALMMISHPNVLQGIDIHQENGQCFLITEYCNGGTLKDVIQKEGRPTIIQVNYHNKNHSKSWSLF